MMLDQPFANPKPVLEKEETMFTADPYGVMVACKYKHPVKDFPQYHAVLLTEGACKGGTCYKEESELFTDKYNVGTK